MCERLSQLGVALDSSRNGRHAEQIAAVGAAVAVLIVPAGEKIVIARDTAGILGS